MRTSAQRHRKAIPDELSGKHRPEDGRDEVRPVLSFSLLPSLSLRRTGRHLCTSSVTSLPAARPSCANFLVVCPPDLIPTSRRLGLAGRLGVTADDLDLVCHHGLCTTVHLESDVLDEEGPHLVAEAVRIQRALCVLAALLSVSCHYHTRAGQSKKASW